MFLEFRTLNNVRVFSLNPVDTVKFSFKTFFSAFQKNILFSSFFLSERIDITRTHWYGEFPRKASEKSYTVCLFILIKIDIVSVYLTTPQPSPPIKNIFYVHFECLQTLRRNKHTVWRKCHTNEKRSVGLYSCAFQLLCFFFFLHFIGEFLFNRYKYTLGRIL